MSIDNTVKAGVFHISFDTRSTPNAIRAVKVTIEVDMLPDDRAAPKHMQERFNVALADHPLYTHLQQYVKSNPR